MEIIRVTDNKSEVGTPLRALTMQVKCEECKPDTNRYAVPEGDRTDTHSWPSHEQDMPCLYGKGICRSGNVRVKNS